MYTLYSYLEKHLDFWEWVPWVIRRTCGVTGREESWAWLHSSGWISYFCCELGSITHSQLSSFNHGYVWFMLSNQIFTPQPIQSHTNQIISRCMLCVHCEGCYGCLFLLNLLTRPRPQTLEEPGARRGVSGERGEQSFTPHHVRNHQDDSRLWPPLCPLPPATCLNPLHTEGFSKKRCKLETLSR